MSNINPSEMLRKLADIIDSMSNEANPGGSNTEINQPKANMTPVEVDHTDTSDPTSMVSPLQQKFEIDKANAGVDSDEGPEEVAVVKVDDGGSDGDAAEGEAHTCETCGKEICECDDEEMNIMRKNAGLGDAKKKPEGEVSEGIRLEMPTWFIR